MKQALMPQKCFPQYKVFNFCFSLHSNETNKDG